MKTKNLKTYILSALLLFFLVVLFFDIRSRMISNAVKREISEKQHLVRKAKDTINSIKFSSEKEQRTMDLIVQLTDDFTSHKKIGSKLTPEEIIHIEDSLNLKLPKSYKLFLQYFGNGSKSIYGIALDNVKNCSFSTNIQNLGDSIQIAYGDSVDTNSLFCLAKDTKGGTWHWITSETSKNGEWPLVYLNPEDNKLYYKINDFIEWLNMLATHKYELINELKKEQTASQEYLN